MSQLFDSLNKPQANTNNPMQMLQTLKNDPISFMRSMGFNIPNGVDFRNPQSIINSLMQSGQINQNAYRQSMNMMSMFQPRK